MACANLALVADTSGRRCWGFIRERSSTQVLGMDRCACLLSHAERRELMSTVAEAVELIKLELRLDRHHRGKKLDPWAGSTRCERVFEHWL